MWLILAWLRLKRSRLETPVRSSGSIFLRHFDLAENVFHSSEFSAKSEKVLYIRFLYFIQVYILIPLVHSSPFLPVSHILLTPIFSYVYYMRNIFLILDDAVDRRKLGI